MDRPLTFHLKVVKILLEFDKFPIFPIRNTIYTYIHFILDMKKRKTFHKMNITNLYLNVYNLKRDLRISKPQLNIK